MVAHLSCEQEVCGSIPSGGSVFTAVILFIVKPNFACVIEQVYHSNVHGMPTMLPKSLWFAGILFYIWWACTIEVVDILFMAA